ncbi:MAG: dockerin type I domain-containing protein [Candidatus Hodarchaeota archaeon]
MKKRILSILILIGITCSNVFLGLNEYKHPNKSTFLGEDISRSAWGEGDVNNDGRIDVVDALMVAQYYVGILSSLPNISVADVSDDGSVNIIDALIIDQNYVGVSTTLQNEIPFNGTTGSPSNVWFEAVPLLIINQTFTTDVYVDTGSQNLAAYGFEIEYDPAIVEVQSVVAGAEGFQSCLDINNTGGRTRVSGFDTMGMGPDSQLELITITWEAVGVGTTIVNNTVDRLVDQDYNTIGTPYIHNITIEVYPLLGDVNGDGAVNATDALMIAQYNIGLNPIAFLPFVADVNDDEIIDCVDALLVYQYDLGIIPEVYTPLPSSGGGTGQVWLDPVEVSGLLGEFWNSLVILNSSTQNWSAFQFDIRYDPAVLNIAGIQPGLDCNPTILNINNSLGITKMTGFNAFGVAPGILELLNITWEVVGNGETTLNLSVDCLVDNTTEPIDTPPITPYNFTVENQDPTVTVVYPNGGEQLQDFVLLQWNASDPENDTLVFDIAYNMESTGWHSIITNHSSNSYNWNISGLPNSDSVIIRVTANDDYGGSSSDESNFSFTVASQHPTGTVVINIGQENTTTTSVMLSLASSSAVMMCFSDDNSSWTTWEPFSGLKSYNLTSGDGQKIVYVRFQDQFGLVSEVDIFDTINLIPEEEDEIPEEALNQIRNLSTLLNFMLAGLLAAIGAFIVQGFIMRKRLKNSKVKRDYPSGKDIKSSE